LRKIFIYLFLLVISASCAHELPLTGGDKDATPPVAEKFSPPNKSTLFNSKKIIIEFDEFVKLKDPNKQILVSPPGTSFEATEKGKSIEVTITSTLKENTTYVINFGEAVVDNNEGNVLNNLVYSFSTGTIIDSLKTGFKVLDAYTLKPVQGVHVMLYEEDIDTLPLTTLPYYAGSTNADGMVNIGYMKPGQFKVFILQEENKNYLYDKPNEGIGFLPDMVTSGDSNSTTIVYFKEIVTNPKIQTVKMPAAGFVQFKFNGEIEKEQIRFISNNYPFDTSKFEFTGTKKDTANYWFKPRLNDDTIQFTFTRNLGEIDTFKITPKTINSFKNNVVTGALQFKIITPPAADFDFYKKLELEFSTPVDSMDTTAIIIKEEGVQIPTILKPMNGTNRKYFFDYVFKQSKNYSIYFPKKSVKSILGNAIDSTYFTFKTSNDKNYKQLSLKILNPEYTAGNGIIQIINDKDVVLDEQIVNWSSGVIIFKNLRQGIYRIKLIYDSNGNSKWDTGNYNDKKQPEKVVFFPQNIDIKPNFDYELEWDIKQR